MLEGLRANGIDIHECHANTWAGVEDKSQVKGLLNKLKLAAAWLASYPRLIWCYLRAPAHDLVLVPYMGHLDVLILWPFARLRGARIAWDAFLSLYDTLVSDRKILRAGSLQARLVKAWEWLATRAADLTILDTRAQAAYFHEQYGLPEDRLSAVWVGAETDRFPLLPPISPKPAGEPCVVLFYGQFIPLHGIETIVRAAAGLDDGSIRWVLIGRGQEEEAVRQLLQQRPVRHLEWIPWVPYESLIERIQGADVCLGVFGESEKAGRVIPNKVFQIIAAGKPLVTRDGPGIRELLPETLPGVELVPPADSAALAAAISRLINRRDSLIGVDIYAEVRPQIAPAGIGAQWVRCVSSVARERPTGPG
jgi:glycosyltransferase involved in cell wall biosynthesis